MLDIVFNFINMFINYIRRSTIIIIGYFFFTLSASAQNVDMDLLNKINPQNPTATFWINTSNLTYPIAAISTATVLSVGYINKNKQLQNKGFKLVGSLAINAIVTYSVKKIINRDRPFEKYPTIIHPYEIKNGYSLPSGHTSVAFATATSLAISCKKWYVVVPAFTWAASVGYSRLYLGLHYPSDVLAGAVIGTGSALLSNWLSSKIFKQKK